MHCARSHSLPACLSSLHTPPPPPPLHPPPPPPPPVADCVCLQCGGHRAAEEAGQRLRSWQRQWRQEAGGIDQLSPSAWLETL